MNNIIRLSILMSFLIYVPGLSAVINVPADHPTIQAGINASYDGDTVLVADGVYTGIGNRDIYFYGKEITMASVNGPDYTIIDCQGDQWNPHKGFLFITEGRSTVLDGFTIRNGSTGPYCLEFSGGGIYCEGSPTIKNCRFIENINRQNSCLYSGGGALFCFLGSPLIVNCVFDNNDSDDFGGAVSSVDALPVFNNCLFSGNSAIQGSAIHSDNSYVFLIDCTFADNSGDSGAVFSSGSSHIEMTNSTLAYNMSSNTAIIQLTMSDILNAVNSILWNVSSPEIDADSTSNIAVTFSDIMGVWPGVGNIDCDPIFCDPESRDFSLSAISCCAGSGFNGNNMGSSAIGCGALGGVVTDQYGAPIEGVTVNIMSTVLQTQTDANGEYLFATVAPDVYDVLFSHPQHRDSLINDLPIPLEYIDLDISLTTSGPCESYSVGDVNGSGNYNGLDITFGVSFFKGGAIPMYECECMPGQTWFVSGDVNATCSYNGLDITYGVNFFKGGDSPAPCPDCPPD
ncbi:MAG: carboxypeptidase regulatory-like domain-containing protein [Candidatus Zixiibacteriota bacterium]|nr:MAG: carboxypeptidase regulatory-like domain-containing protein [candidate division Zixibacteria bacterium]